MNFIIEAISPFIASPLNIITLMLYGVSSLILAIVHIEFLKTLYGVRIAKNKEILFVSCYFFLKIVSKVFFDIWLCKFITLCIVPLYFYWVLKFPFNKTIFFSCIIGTIAVTADMLVINTLNYRNVVNCIQKQNMISIFITYISIFTESIIIHILKLKNINLVGEKYDKKSIALAILFFTIILSQIIEMSLCMLKKPTNMCILDACILVFYLLITLNNVKKRREDNAKNEVVKGLAMHNKTLRLCTQNVEVFKNEFISIMQDFGGYIKYDDFESLKNYYNLIMSEYRDANKMTVLNPNVINDSALYNIICNKYYYAKDKGIQMELEVKMDFKKINMKIYELARMLGIFLDNAIEAAKHCEDKKISILFLQKENKDIIKIFNTYEANQEINIDKIFEKGYSTKENNTGLGLWEVRQILKRHSNLDLYTYKENNIFCQELSIYHN